MDFFFVAETTLNLSIVSCVTYVAILFLSVDIFSPYFIIDKVTSPVLLSSHKR